MTETLTLDEAGRLVLSHAALRLMGLRPGETLQAVVTRRGIEILDNAGADFPTVEAEETQLEDGMLVVAPIGIQADIAAAIRAERDELAGRPVPRE